MARWNRQDYVGDTVTLARKLVGALLVRRYEGELLVCRITETEAYVGAVDKACHAYQYRKTRRNATMFGPPGHAYLYLIYGMHACLNFVTNPEGEPDAVLLRGLDVLQGRETMHWVATKKLVVFGGAKVTCHTKFNNKIVKKLLSALLG